jgi:hypothetical protein
MISVWMCDRRSNVSGSIVWYSSSMPIENVGFMPGPGERRSTGSRRGGRLERLGEPRNAATVSTIQSKFACPTECGSASGAGFMKSIAYGTPSSTANSTVFRS